MSEIEREQDHPNFVCDTDQKAEWCMEQIRRAEAEKAKWKAFYDEQYKKVCDAEDSTIETMKAFLYSYFETVPHKTTKTEENYRLPSGKLVLKRQEPEFRYEDAELVAWLRANQADKYVKVKESTDWAALKKTLTVIGETVADEEGQIIPCITAAERPDIFTIGK